LVPVAAVAMIAIAFSFAPVRTFAADILNIFRVKNIEVVSFSPQDMQQMEQQMKKVGGENGGVANIENFGKIESSGFKQPAEMSMEDAQKVAGFALKLPEQIDGQVRDAKVEVINGSKMSFTLDVKKANKMIAVYGGDVLLPEELDGKTFSIKIPTGVAANYQKVGGMITVAQAESPEMVVPDGVDPDAVRNVLLSLPMVPENVRQQLEAIEDWKQTLVIPNIGGSSQEVDVNGAKGVFMKPPVEKGIGQNENASLLWQSDGIVYMVGGNLDLAKAQDIAASMK
jgi:hypothetical protein